MIDERFIKRREVEKLVALSRSAIYALIQNNQFPRPVVIGRMAVAWRETEVRAWMDARVAARDGKAP